MVNTGDEIWLYNIHLLCLLYKTSFLYQINHIIMVSMPGLSSLGHLSPENSLEQIHIATVNVYVRHQGRDTTSEPVLNHTITELLFSLFFSPCFLQAKQPSAVSPG